MKTYLFVALFASTAACSSEPKPAPITPDVAHSPVPAASMAPQTMVAEAMPAAESYKVPSTTPPVPPAQTPPGGFNGIPWKNCTPATGTHDCTENSFRKTSIGMLKDGAGENVFNNVVACQANYCRADLALNTNNYLHQCMSGDTVVCTLADSGFQGSATCSNGAWGACGATPAAHVAATRKEPKPTALASKVETATK